MSKNPYLLQHNTLVWFCLLIVGALVLLSACGSSTPNTSAAAAPTVAAPSPTTGTTNTSPSPTPTPARPVPTSPPVSGTTQTVLITNMSNGSFGFSPTTLTIKAGTTIVWKNMSSAPHTVTTDDGTTTDSGTIPVGGTFRFKFTTPGTFPYHCNYHPYMRATIVVQ
ncbi:MAG: cupredoxin domain-containing protein [Ktedonobacteraceae bacterium]